MSDFECPVVEVKAVLEHPNADKLECVQILDGYQVVSQKGLYKAGDLAVYFPEASIMPEVIQEELGLTGFLSGPDKDRLKAVKLRGEISQGILMRISSLDFDVTLGEDLSEKLGIEKYVPRVPANFSGKWVGTPTEFTPTKYDIENIKKVGGYFGDGEEVVITEKLHGTFCQIIIAFVDEAPEGFFKIDDGIYGAATSKGVGRQGFVMDSYDAAADSNLYVKALKEYFTPRVVDELSLALMEVGIRGSIGFQIMGEIYGMGVQDLTYGESKPKFRVFDLRQIHTSGERVYLDSRHVIWGCAASGLEYVPVVYQGPFSRGVLNQHTHGESTLKDGQIREGVVVRPVFERKSYRGNRIIAKSVSEQYLLRKGSKGQAPTEYN